MADLQADLTKSIHTATASMAAYQKKLMEIAQENTEFTVQYTQALMSIRAPSDLMTVNTEYAKKRMELFQRHSQELAALAKSTSE